MASESPLDIFPPSQPNRAPFGIAPRIAPSTSIDLAATTRYASYEEYISSLCRNWPEYQWLREFFQHRPVLPEGLAVMINARDGDISTTSYRPRDRERLKNALDLPTTIIHTQIIIIPYKRPEDVDRGLLDTLGLALDIDPLFYWHHFDTRKDHEDDLRASSHPRKTPCLLSRRRSLEFGFFNFLHASVLFIPRGNNPDRRWIVVVLLRSLKGCQSSAPEFGRPSIYDSAGERHITRYRDLCLRFQSILQTWSREDIKSANKEPIEFIYPLAHLMAAEEAYRLHHEFSFEKFRGLAFSGKRDWVRYSFEFEASLFRYAIEMHFRAMKATLENLRHPYGDFSWSDPDAVRQSKKSLELIRNYESLLETAGNLLSELNTIETRSINHRSVKASQESMEQSESLSRLTTLAFFFIPLSFATSIFGMNVEELGSGTVKMRIVALTTTCILAFAAICWLVSSSISRLLRAFYTNLDGIRFRLRVLKAFSSIYPRGAFWLFVFGLTHDPETFTALVRELGIWQVLGLRKEWDAPVLGTEDQRIVLSRFWQRRAEEIASVTRRRGWQRVNVWTQWRQGGSDRGDVQE